MARELRPHRGRKSAHRLGCRAESLYPKQQNYCLVFLLLASPRHLIARGVFRVIFVQRFKSIRNTSAVTVISSITGTFCLLRAAISRLTVQWGSQYLLISNNNTQNDYWIWDGDATATSAGLYASGGLGPDITILANGSNYNSLPTVTVYGDTGSGAVIVPTIGDGGVILLNITNPGSGYGIGDQPQIAFSGGGSGGRPQRHFCMAVLASRRCCTRWTSPTAATHYTTPPTIRLYRWWR